MPRKRPGLHLFHVELPEENWQLLQRYCFGGIERISATAIVNTLVNAYVEEHLKPRLAEDQVAETQPIRLDISKTIKKVAHRIEPDEFPEA